MITQLSVERPLALGALSEAQLGANIERVLTGDMPGFVISAAMPDAFNRSIRYANDSQLQGGINSTTMTFNYESTASGLAIARSEGTVPGPEEWEQYGITSLHADGEEGDQMVSISRAMMGAYTIHVLQRGPSRKEDVPIELWDTLQEENTRLLLDGYVDTDNLRPEMTSFDVTVGDTIIFNPSQPHMGVTTVAPRKAETTFFRRSAV